MQAWTDLGWVDLTLLAVLLVSVIVGLVRGFVFELLSLAGWVAAWFGAQWLAPDLAPQLPIGAPGSPLNLGAAFALAFLAGLIVWGLAAKLVRFMLHATPLKLPDRLLGGLFGLLRGAVLLLALATLIGLTPWARAPAWQQSRAAPVLHAMLQGLLPLLPPKVTDHLRVAARD